MAEISITHPEASPAFDMEEFMNFARETRIASATLEKLVDIWENWQSRLQTARIQHDKNSWLAIWLPVEIEDAVDKAWENSPGEGYLINSLAQYMCMAAVGALLPQTIDGGCAPSPEPAAPLVEGLARLGLAQPGKRELSLNRRFAVLTHYPYRGGCEICALRENCPKAQSGESYASVVLPGYERGIDG